MNTVTISNEVIDISTTLRAIAALAWMDRIPDSKLTAEQIEAREALRAALEK